MTRKEFACCMAYLEAGIGVTMPKEQAEVYFSTFKHLPQETLQVACQRVLLSHGYKSFPLASEIALAAAETLRGRLQLLQPLEAWGEAKKGLARYHADLVDSWERVKSVVPDNVYRAMQNVGVKRLADAPPHVAEKMFLTAFAEIAAEEKKRALLPPSLVKQIESQGRQALPAPVQETLRLIGAERCP